MHIHTLSHVSETTTTTTQQQAATTTTTTTPNTTTTTQMDGLRVTFRVDAEGEVPTAANLNLYRGWKSCVGWHCDDEPLFGKCGDAKLIVSVSFGSFAVFRWRRQSCPSDEGRSCWLDHGDVLAMDGQCQDEFLHRTDPGREQDRINITFRWVKTACFLLSFV